MKWKTVAYAYKERQIIFIEEGWEDKHGMMKDFRSNILNLKEGVIRDALIKLGWTPPKEESE